MLASVFGNEAPSERFSVVNAAYRLQALFGAFFVLLTIVEPASAAKLTCDGMIWGLHKFTIDTESGAFEAIDNPNFELSSAVTTTDEYYRFDIALVARSMTNHISIERSSGAFYGNGQYAGTCRLAKPPVM